MSPHVLHSWKEISQHVRATVRTVQRWEVSAHFPIRRVKRTGSVFALVDEVDLWLRSRATPQKDQQLEMLRELRDLAIHNGKMLEQLLGNVTGKRRELALDTRKRDC